MAKYLSTTNIASLYDVSPDFFRNRINTTFKRGIHYIQHDRQCPIRWVVDEIESWWRGENKIIHDDLVERLLQ